MLLEGEEVVKGDMAECKCHCVTECNEDMPESTSDEVEIAVKSQNLTLLELIQAVNKNLYLRDVL
jgi:hypothetical protein